MTLKAFIVIGVGSLIGALLDAALGVKIEPWWKDLLHTAYWMGFGIIFWEA